MVDVPANDEISADEAAAEANDYIEAVHLKLAAMATFAIKVVVKAGVMRSPDMESDQRDPLEIAAEACGLFLDSIPDPFDQPSSGIRAAAKFIWLLHEFRIECLDIFQDAERAKDVNEMHRLFWIMAEFGALGEMFRAHMFGFDLAPKRLSLILASKLPGGLARGAAKTLKAEAWKLPARAWAQQILEEGKLGASPTNYGLAEYLVDNWTARPFPAECVRPDGSTGAPAVENLTRRIIPGWRKDAAIAALMSQH